jgi:hypothetical protein
MTCAVEYDIDICMGVTWRYVAMWFTEPFIYKAITGVPQLAPLRLTVTGHGLVDYQRVAISDVLGMRELNAPEEPPDITDFLNQTVVDANTIEINSINASSYHAYTGGGNIRAHTPVDITGYLARMDIKDKVGGTILFTLSTTNGRIVVDNATKQITLLITDDESALFTWRRGVYTLELESPSGEVAALLTGRVTVIREVTTTETP